MPEEERLMIAATGGLVIVAVGTFLPWARIGGRNRSGFETADVFIGLGSSSLPDALSWVGRWWYLPAILTLAVWLSVLFRGSQGLRVGSAILVLISLSMWWLFVWAGWNWSVIDVAWTGPIVTTVGILVLARSAISRRQSLLSSGTNRTEPSTQHPTFDKEMT